MSTASFPRLRTFLLTRTGRAAEGGLLALCGALFTLVFPGIDLPFFVWIGLLPVILLTWDHTPGKAFLRGYVWGFFWALTAFFWFREICFIIPLFAGLVLGFFPALWCGVCAWLKRNLERPVLVRLQGESVWGNVLPFRSRKDALFYLFASASLWCLLEQMRSTVFTGLPWNDLGVTQVRNVILSQIAEYTGVRGISFVIALVNTACALTLYDWQESIHLHRYVRPLPLLTALAVAAAAFGLGGHLLHRAQMTPMKTIPCRIGVVQSGFPALRHVSRERSREAMNVCFDLSEKLMHSTVVPEVIIWPETAVPVPFRGGSETADLYRKTMSSFQLRYKIPMLIGSIDFRPDRKDPEQYEVLNAALLVHGYPAEVRDAYYKDHLVPFGEYVPFRSYLPFLEDLIGMGHSLSPGGTQNPLEIRPGVRAGVSICYESVFPQISGNHVRNGANLLVVIADDSWYPTSNEPDQHFANAVLRTIENRLPMVRVGNSNYTCVIDPLGRVADKVQPELAKRARAVKVMTVDVPVNPVRTVYSRFGNHFCLLCFLLMLPALLTAFLNWMTLRRAQSDPEYYRKTMESGGNAL